MPVSVQIVFHEINHSEPLEKFIREKVRKLETMHPTLMSCRVSIEQAHRHQNQGRFFGVHILLHVPGGELAVNHEHHHDAYVAVRDALDAAHRQLEAHAERLRGEVKFHEQRETKAE